MRCLDNPRGLAWDDGALYVAEAGRGGTAPCTTLDPPRAGTACFGPTGAVSRLRRGVQRRIAAGLPSYIGPAPQNDVTGPHDVSIRDDRIFVALGLGGGPAFRAALHPGLNRPTSFVIVREDDDDEGDDDDGDDKGRNGYAKLGNSDDDDDDDDDDDEDEDRLTFYIANCGVCIGTGEVIKIQP